MSEPIDEQPESEELSDQALDEREAIERCEITASPVTAGELTVFSGVDGPLEQETIDIAWRSASLAEVLQKAIAEIGLTEDDAEPVEQNRVEQARVREAWASWLEACARHLRAGTLDQLAPTPIFPELDGVEPEADQEPES